MVGSPEVNFDGNVFVIDHTVNININLEWKPIEFTYPRFSSNGKLLADREPSPYRPFRWGKYKSVNQLKFKDNASQSDYPSLISITMGIRSMPWEEWVEVSYKLYLVLQAQSCEKKCIRNVLCSCFNSFSFLM